MSTSGVMAAKVSIDMSTNSMRRTSTSSAPSSDGAELVLVRVIEFVLMSLLTLAVITPLVLIDDRRRPDDTRYWPDRDLHKFAVAAN